MPKNNVNPGRYKEAGRERQGEDIVQEEHRERLTQEQAERRAEQDRAREGQGSPKPPGR